MPVRVAVSGVMGMRGKLCRLARMSHWEPAIVVMMARMNAIRPAAPHVVSPNTRVL